MADLSGVTENYFPTVSETFADTLSSTILALAVTVPVTNLSEYDDGDVVVLTVEPGTASEATCVGVKASTPYRLTSVVWTEGNLGVGHSAGATVIDYDSATHYNLLTKWAKLIANQDGTLKAQPIRDALGLSAASTNGWEVFPYTMAVTSGYNQGNGSFEIGVASQDVTGIVSPGMKLRIERGTTAPTQCADFESGSSHYATKAGPAGITYTDDFVVEAWANFESYTQGSIISRFNGTSGWVLDTNSTGSIRLLGYNAGAGNVSYVQSYQSVPLAKWIHIAAQLDMSAFTATTTTSYIMINGISVPVAVIRAGTNPTALVQAGDLQVGSSNTANYFDGKLADIRVWSAKRTQTEITDNMNQQLVGTETNLVAYFKLNGDFNDSTANANNLTATNGVVATTVDNPMKDTQYAVVTKVAYGAPNSTITVFTGSEHIIPNMTLNSPYYSTQSSPHGFPKAEDKWYLEVLHLAQYNNGAITAGNYTNIASARINLPVGSWKVSHKAYIQCTNGATPANMSASQALSESSTTYSGLVATRTTSRSPNISSGVTENDGMVYGEAEYDATVATPLYLVQKAITANSTIFTNGATDSGATVIKAKFGLLG